MKPIVPSVLPTVLPPSPTPIDFGKVTDPLMTGLTSGLRGVVGWLPIWHLPWYFWASLGGLIVAVFILFVYNNFLK